MYKYRFHIAILISIAVLLIWQDLTLTGCSFLLLMFTAAETEEL